MSFIPLFLSLRYNTRDEPISADDISYAYDDIGIHAPTSGNEMGSCAIASSSTAHAPQKGLLTHAYFPTLPKRTAQIY